MMPIAAMRLKKVGIDANALAIYNALVAYWDMEDNVSSPTLLDSKGSNHLTLRNTAGAVNSNGITTPSGLVSRGYNPNMGTGQTAYIPRSNTNLDLPNSDFSFGGWFTSIANVAGSGRFIMGRVGSTGNATQAYISIEGADNKVKWQATTDGTVGGRIIVDTGFIFTALTWVLIIGTLNRTSNQLEIRFRQVGAGSMTKVTGSFPSAIYTTSNVSNFNISGGLSSDTTYFTGGREGVVRADECFYATKAISDAEFDYLYNGGNGKNFAAIRADSGN